MLPPIVFILFAVVGVAFVLAGTPLARGSVPPNWFFGFRTPRTRSDPRAWAAINKVGGEDLKLAGFTMVAMSALLGTAATLLGGVPVEPAVLGIMWPAMVAVIHTFVVASQIVYDLDHPGEEGFGTLARLEAEARPASVVDELDALERARKAREAQRDRQA